MKEEMLEAIYGTVERLEQKVDELSSSPKNTETGNTPVPVSVDTSKLEKAIIAMAVKEGEALDKLVRLREAICIFTDLTKKEASKDEQRSKLLFDTVNQVKQELNATSKIVQDKLHAMDTRVDKNEKRQKRHLRSRQYIIGTAEKPRLNVYRSLSNIYAQVINDVTGETIVAASTVEKDLKANYGGNTEAAKAVGKAIAEKALAKGIKEVVFDRGGYLYTGRVAALADAAREAGLQF